MSTLNYASKASTIVNTHKKMIDKRDETIIGLRNEVELLKQQLLQKQSIPISISQYSNNEIEKQQQSNLSNSKEKEYKEQVFLNIYQIEKLKYDNSKLSSQINALQERCVMLSNENNDLYMRLEELERIFGVYFILFRINKININK